MHVEMLIEMDLRARAEIGPAAAAAAKGTRPGLLRATTLLPCADAGGVFAEHARARAEVLRMEQWEAPIKSLTQISRCAHFVMVGTQVQLPLAGSGAVAARSGIQGFAVLHSLVGHAIVTETRLHAGAVGQDRTRTQSSPLACWGQWAL